jgi:hypothetical protein
MLIFDIDDTLSPTRPVEPFPLPATSERAWAFEVLVPDFLLSFLRERDDIVLLSTWGSAAKKFAEAFALPARVAVMEDFTPKVGIKGKFEVVRQLQPTGWADDHMTPAMVKALEPFGTVTVKPTKGYITEKQLAIFVAKLASAPLYTPTPATSLLHGGPHA